MTSFASQLKYGQAGESAIAAWLYSKGFCVLPVYEKIIDTGKGPQLFSATESLVAPDIVAIARNRPIRWIEAKHKSAFTYYRKTGRWQTGIDLRHYEDYCKVAAVTAWPVWLMFLHEGGCDIHTGQESPTGLYAQKLSVLQECVDHVDRGEKNNSTSGMVYWNIEDLERMASLDEVTAAMFLRQN